MDIQTFIQSGLLESYILGQCTADEQAQVERMAAAHPEVRAELESIETALENYATAQAITPPADLKDRILREINAAPDPAGTSVPDRVPVPGLVWLLAAALGLLVAFSVYQQSKASAENAALQAQIAALQKDKDDCEKRGQQDQRIFALLRDKQNTTTIELKVGDHNKVFIYQNTQLGETAFDGTDMVRRPPNGYFQLWALMPNGGAPQSLGMVGDHAINNWQHLPHYKDAIGFAISIEDNERGHDTPNLPPFSAGMM